MQQKSNMPPELCSLLAFMENSWPEQPEKEKYQIAARLIRHFILNVFSYI